MAAILMSSSIGPDVILCEVSTVGVDKARPGIQVRRVPVKICLCWLPSTFIRIERFGVNTPRGYHGGMTTDAIAEQVETVASENCSVAGHHHGYLVTKDAYLSRLRRIEGQVRGIARMVEEEKYCIDILTQISAATSALQSVALGLLDEHLRSCVFDAARQGEAEGLAKLDEASKAIARLVRS